MDCIGVGLYGKNGHQMNGALGGDTGLCLRGVCGGADGDAPQFDTLEEMLASPQIGLVSLCSPVREEQARHALLALEAGKNVVAEKPCAMTEEALDAILDTAARRGLVFCEMDASHFAQPYHYATQLVCAGAVGEVTQVFCQKSYPYAGRRPQDERVDGGLLLQCALYGFRWIMHVAGQEIVHVDAVETTHGNPEGGGLRMAASVQMQLRDGGLGTVIANYRNTAGTGVWGFEELKIFGTRGILQTCAADKSICLYTDAGMETFRDIPSAGDQFSRIAYAVRTGDALYMSPYDVTLPTRWAIRAREAAHRNARM